MKRLLQLLPLAACALALAPSHSIAGVDPSCYGGWNKTGTLAMRRFLAFAALLAACFALAPQPARATTHSMLGTKPSHTPRTSLTRTFHQKHTARNAAAFSMSFTEFADLYAFGGIVTVYDKTTDETYEDGYVYDMDVGLTDTSAPSVYLLPEIDFDDSYTFRITDPADTPFADEFAHATHALVEEYEPGDYEEGYYYAEYYVIDPTGIYSVGVIEVEDDGSESSESASASAETLRATFPLDEALGFEKILVGYDEDLEEDVQTWQIVEMHGYGLLDLGDQFDGEVVEVGAFIDDINYQKPGETDPNEVLGFETLYTMVGEDGTLLSFYVAVPECTDDDGCDVAFKGEIEITDIELWRVTPADAVANERGAALLEGLALHAPYPNPAQGSTTLGYTLPATGAVHLALYDALGREVALLAQGTKPAGDYEATLDAATLPSGVYLARLTTGAHALTQRVVLSR